MFAKKELHFVFSASVAREGSCSVTVLTTVQQKTIRLRKMELMFKFKGFSEEKRLLYT